MKKKALNERLFYKGRKKLLSTRDLYFYAAVSA